MNLIENTKIIQQQKIIEYYEEKLEEACNIFWDLSDNPYRTTQMTNDEINRMRAFLENFEYQKGGMYR